MGLCLSSGGAAMAAAEVGKTVPSTAMVLLPTGELREYPRPATAARVLDDVARAAADDGGWFLCDADAMEFEGAVAAVAPSAGLRPGQIYFVLPAEVRRRGMRREEVAALAVKASAALAKAAVATTAAASGCCRRRRGAVVAPFVFAPPEEEHHITVAAGKARPSPATGKKTRRGQHQRFAPDLSAIAECDVSTE